ncbi:uncharacterized protein LOC128858288 [Anastrepha ludens]|uniref:uncharacterized protein LOC128858288 n=1 Tax=Anastrepha ludens TaxID=28586 RepID=UPI0023AEDD80|nr:uncharacterized protein LOC128858288 [Anastrepha ludens]
MLRAPSRLTLSVAIGVGVTLGYWCYWWYRQWKNCSSMPKKWRRIGTLDQINIFPLNFGAPLQFDADAEVDCDMFGLKLNDCRDRALVIVSDENDMITEETYPRTMLINTKLVGSQLELSAPGMETITLDVSILKTEREQLEMMTRRIYIKVYLVGAKYDKWLSKFLLNKDSGIRLVHYPIKERAKPIDSGMAQGPAILKDDDGTFNDAINFVLINLSSIEQINARLRQSVDPLMFHGSFHLKMDSHDPFAEESWKWIKIGDNVIFRVIADNEPGIAIRKDLPFTSFIVYLGLRAAGTIKKGAVIYVPNK